MSDIEQIKEAIERFGEANAHLSAIEQMQFMEYIQGTSKNSSHTESAESFS